jgi:hypothetical protein
MLRRSVRPGIRSAQRFDTRSRSAPGCCESLQMAEQQRAGEEGAVGERYEQMVNTRKAASAEEQVEAAEQAPGLAGCRRAGAAGPDAAPPALSRRVGAGNGAGHYRLVGTVKSRLHRAAPAPRRHREPVLRTCCETSQRKNRGNRNQSFQLTRRVAASRGGQLPPADAPACRACASAAARAALDGDWLPRVGGWPRPWPRPRRLLAALRHWAPPRRARLKISHRRLLRAEPSASYNDGCRRSHGARAGQLRAAEHRR